MKHCALNQIIGWNGESFSSSLFIKESYITQHQIISECNLENLTVTDYFCINETAHCYAAVVKDAVRKQKYIVVLLCVKQWPTCGTLQTHENKAQSKLPLSERHVYRALNHDWGLHYNAKLYVILHNVILLSK